MSNSWQYARSLWREAEDRPIASRGAVLVLRRHYAEPGLVGRMARLEDFCDRTNGLPHVWGQSDCSLLIADWAIENGYPDSAAPLRGAYDSEETCRALLAAEGGLVAVVGDCADRIGLTPLHEPEFGSVAVIGSATNPDRQWSAIWNGARWLVRWVSLRNGHEVPSWSPFVAKPLGIWRV